MYKELIISSIIVVSIFLLDYATQKCTDNYINEAIQDLKEIKEIIQKKDVDNEKAKKNIKEKYEKWLKYHKVLAFFIEHNELEKVETNYVSVKSLVKSSEFENALSELEKTIYVLEHIHDKYSVKWANIF